MTLKFLVDENFNHKTLAGIKRREPDLDIVAVQEVGLRETDDPEVLEWAAQEGRIVVTHDVSTFSVFAFERVAAGLPMPGVIEIPESVPMRVIIDELILIAARAIRTSGRIRSVTSHFADHVVCVGGPLHHWPWGGGLPGPADWRRYAR